jgi:hypothetical protein
VAGTPEGLAEFGQWSNSTMVLWSTTTQALPAVVGHSAGDLKLPTIRGPAVTGSYRQLPAVTGSYRRLPAVTGSYRQLLPTMLSYCQ